MTDDKAELDRVTAQEQALELSRFSAADAWWLGCEMHRLASARNAPVAIEIVRGTTTLFSALLPGATADNQNWIRRKVATTVRFEQSSYAIHLKLRAGDNLFARFGLDYQTFAAAGGAVPIQISGTGMIGAAAISGLPQVDDHELVVAALLALKAQQEKG